MEQVGMFSHKQEVEMTRRYRKNHDLFGYEADDLLNSFDDLKEQDIWQYRYPDNLQLRNVGVRGIYIGNYVRWDPIAQHKEMVKIYSYKTAKLSRTFDIYDYVDCYNYLNIHDALKLNKHGYSKVTDHVCREIRHGRLNREQGEILVREYEQKSVSYAPLFLDYLSMTKRGLDFVLDYHRNNNFWEKHDFGRWEFNGWSARRNFGLDAESKQWNKVDKFTASFIESHDLSLDKAPSYVTIGKGWP